MERKVILFIAMSLDGYIAKPDDDISFLSMVGQEGEDYGYASFVKNVDTVIWGRRTYEKVLSFGVEFPHAGRNVFVMTSKPLQDYGPVRFYSGSVKELIERLKRQDGKNIYVDGGSVLVNEMLRYQLIDEFYISVIPILLGDGIPLFRKGIPEQKLKLAGSQHFEKGLVQMHYVRTVNETE
ncbi:MAG: dihydrofolate reductase family protein [Prolixibacteraceae bacterium]|nr:dihydrofolate reductase family protein [Prolixibacteraceae bacterium]